MAAGPHGDEGHHPGIIEYREHTRGVPAGRRAGGHWRDRSLTSLTHNTRRRSRLSATVLPASDERRWTWPATGRRGASEEMTMVRSRTGCGRPRSRVGAVAMVCASMVCMAGAARAQSPAPVAGTRAAEIAAQQQEKAQTAKPYEPNKAEVWVKKLEEQFLTGALHWHPFFDSAYAGGGFTLGAGYCAVCRRVQHDRPARQLDAERLYAVRSRVPGPAPVRPPGRPLRDRRLAGGDTGRLLRPGDRPHLEG